MLQSKHGPEKKCYVLMMLEYLYNLYVIFLYLILFNIFA